MPATAFVWPLPFCLTNTGTQSGAKAPVGIAFRINEARKPSHHVNRGLMTQKYMFKEFVDN
jgi:hypothetical protein